MKKPKIVKLLISPRAMAIFAVRPYKKRKRITRIRKNLFRELKAMNKELKRTADEDFTIRNWSEII